MSTYLAMQNIHPNSYTFTPGQYYGQQLYASSTPLPSAKPDRVELHQAANESHVESHSEPGQSVKETRMNWKSAGKNFIAGLLHPISVLAKAPLWSLFTGVAALIIAAAVPALAPIVLGLGVAVSAFNIIKGSSKAIYHYAKGNYEKSAEAFKDIGDGTFGLLMTAVGVRKCAAEAAHTRAIGIKAIKRDGLSCFIQSADAAVDVSKLSRFQAFKYSMKSLINFEFGAGLNEQVKLARFFKMPTKHIPAISEWMHHHFGGPISSRIANGGNLIMEFTEIVAKDKRAQKAAQHSHPVTA